MFYLSKRCFCGVALSLFFFICQVDVNGNNAAPLYKYLKSNKGGLFGDSIKWNFSKFLVDKEGRVVDRYAPTTSPLSIEVMSCTTTCNLFLQAELLGSHYNISILSLQKDIKKLLGSS